MIAVQTSSFDNFMQLLGTLLIFIFVIGITYATTHWIARYQKCHSFNKNLKIVETLRITNNKYIQMIEAGDEYLVVAIGKDEVQLLTKLTKEQLKELPMDELPTQFSTESFKEIFERVKEHIPKK